MSWLDAKPEGSPDEDAKETKMALDARGRWGVPTAEPMKGKCDACDWFRRLDGDFALLEYGDCIAVKFTALSEPKVCCSNCCLVTVRNRASRVCDRRRLPVSDNVDEPGIEPQLSWTSFITDTAVTGLERLASRNSG